MRTYAAVAAVFALLSGAAVARAQEAPAPAPSDDQENEQAQPRREIQVLQSPYDISSFYRSSQGQEGFGYELGAGPSAASGPYAIAGFYRSRGSARGGYSMFWTNGYGTSPMRGRSFLVPRRSRALGLNGDLCLFAPFLAPVGPLSGVFWSR